MTRLTIGRTRAYDAIVVGARAAGAATAMLLARGGRHVLLVDRSECGADTLSTHALMRGAVRQLHRWGLLEAVRRANTPAIRRTVFHYGDETVDITLRPHDGVDALYAPRRTILDRILVDAARAAGAEVVYGSGVTGVQRDSAGRVTGIRGRTRLGTEAVATAPVVIGADGLHSTIARCVGAETEYETKSASAFVYGYFADVGSQQYDWYFRPGASAGVIPTNDGVANVFVGWSAARFAEEARTRPPGAAFSSVLAQAAPDLADELSGREPVGRYRSFPGHVGRLRRAHGPGWALVGDAGYFKDPLTSHGITDALRDAELLARAVLASPTAAPDLATYQAERDRLAHRFMDITAATASYTWSLAELQALHLDLKEAMDDHLDVLAELDERETHAA